MSNLKLHEKFIINDEGEKTDVVLPFDEYEELLEDFHDLSVIAERKSESTINFEDIKKKYSSNEL